MQRHNSPEQKTQTNAVIEKYRFPIIEKLRSLMVRQEIVVEAPCPSPEPRTPPPVMNFDLFKENIESCLKVDKKKTIKEPNPMELYFKSNPALLTDFSKPQRHKSKKPETEPMKLSVYAPLPAIPQKRQPTHTKERQRKPYVRQSVQLPLLTSSHSLTSSPVSKEEFKDDDDLEPANFFVTRSAPVTHVRQHARASIT